MKKHKRVKQCIKIITIFMYLFISSRIIFSSELSDIGDSIQINNFIDVLDKYMSENNMDKIDINKMYGELVNGKNIELNSILENMKDIVVKEIKNTFQNVSVIFYIVILSAILVNLSLEKESEVVQITNMIILLVASVLLIKNYIEIIEMFKNIINTIVNIMQICSIFLMGILVASGKIVSTGTIQPLILFVTNAILAITNYIVIPFFSISIGISIISKLTENIKMDSLSKLFRKSSLVVFSAGIAIFVFVLSMETSITKSFDGIYFKASQTVISSTVPVVGKFLSDSLDTVLSATGLIGKIGGKLAIISALLIVSIPIIKITVVWITYLILKAISEPIGGNENILKLIEDFSKIYKDILGIMIGCMVLFVMATGIILNIISNIGS